MITTWRWFWSLGLSFMLIPLTTSAIDWDRAKIISTTKSGQARVILETIQAQRVAGWVEASLPLDIATQWEFAIEASNGATIINWDKSMSALKVANVREAFSTPAEMNLEPGEYFLRVTIEDNFRRLITQTTKKVVVIAPQEEKVSNNPSRTRTITRTSKLLELTVPPVVFTSVDQPWNGEIKIKNPLSKLITGTLSARILRGEKEFPWFAEPFAAEGQSETTVAVSEPFSPEWGAGLAEVVFELRDQRNKLVSGQYRQDIALPGPVLEPSPPEYAWTANGDLEMQIQGVTNLQASPAPSIKIDSISGAPTISLEIIETYFFRGKTVIPASVAQSLTLGGEITASAYQGSTLITTFTWVVPANPDAIAQAQAEADRWKALQEEEVADESTLDWKVVMVLGVIVFLLVLIGASLWRKKFLLWGAVFLAGGFFSSTTQAQYFVNEEPAYSFVWLLPMDYWLLNPDAETGFQTLKLQGFVRDTVNNVPFFVDKVDNGDGTETYFYIDPSDLNEVGAAFQHTETGEFIELDIPTEDVTLEGGYKFTINIDLTTVPELLTDGKWTIALGFDLDKNAALVSIGGDSTATENIIIGSDIEQGPINVWDNTAPTLSVFDYQNRDASDGKTDPTDQPVDVIFDCTDEGSGCALFTKTEGGSQVLGCDYLVDPTDCQDWDFTVPVRGNFCDDQDYCASGDRNSAIRQFLICDRAGNCSETEKVVIDWFDQWAPQLTEGSIPLIYGESNNELYTLGDGEDVKLRATDNITFKFSSVDVEEGDITDLDINVCGDSNFMVYEALCQQMKNSDKPSIRICQTDGELGLWDLSSASCDTSICPEGYEKVGESCYLIITDEEGEDALVDSDGAAADIETPAETVYGNGIIEDGEECDDGNLEAADGCNEFGQIERSYVCHYEPSQCYLTAVWSGNGVVDSAKGELCDDGNLLPGDGCDPAGQVEPGFTCQTPSGLLSVCSPNCTLLNPGTFLYFELQGCEDRL